VPDSLDATRTSPNEQPTSGLRVTVAMTDWTAIVVARPEPEGGPMASRLPSFIHPIAGRPLVWHTISALTQLRVPPSEVVVVAPSDFPMEFLEGVGIQLRMAPQADPGGGGLPDSLIASDRPAVVIHASASLDREAVSRLLSAEAGVWIDGRHGTAAAILLEPGGLGATLEQETPFAVSSGRLDPLRRLVDTPAAFVVQSREDLARAHQRVRDNLVRSLMQGGVTFLLPDSVTVDVDVRIGRDTVVYPGVVLEGQTNIGEETVIGPGCRITDSWIGSGVELKGWNYIANTSVRNRAILEPYVRRGFS